MQKLMKFMAFFCGVFITAAMCTIIYMGHNRVVVIAESGPDASQNYAQEAVSGTPIVLKQTYAGGAVFRIPIEDGITAEQITIENVYSEQKLVITLQGTTGDIYRNNQIEGYISAIETAVFQEADEKVTIHIQLTEAYEYESFLESNCLKVNLYKPSEKYDRIVVLDESEKDTLAAEEQELLHDITEAVQLKLEENGIRVYHLEDQGAIIENDEKLELVEQLEAGMYLGIGLWVENDNPELFGTVTTCNTTYFRPYISNGMLADMLEREVVTAVSGKAVGIVVDKENEMLKGLEIPAAVVYPGHVSNAQEYEYMKQPSYQDKIATGFVNGVLQAYEMLETTPETE